MRLQVIEPDQLTDAQKPLYDELHDSIKRFLPDFTTQRPDGALIGPFNALLHFPDLGTAAWSMFLALTEKPVLPPFAREVVILLTGSSLDSMYEIYSHEAVAKRKGMDPLKIRTIAAGQRPPDLAEEEALAFDVAAILLRGGQVHQSLYDAAVAAFSERGLAEIAYLTGCYTIISNLLNVFDVALPQTEGA